MKMFQTPFAQQEAKRKKDFFKLTIVAMTFSEMVLKNK